MSKGALADLAEKLGPSTMASRIGKMPMEIQKTLLAPMLDSSPSTRSMKKYQDAYEQEDGSNDPYKSMIKHGLGGAHGYGSRTNPYR